MVLVPTSFHKGAGEISWKIGCFLWEGSRSSLPRPSEDPLILVNLVHQKLEAVRISLIASGLSMDL